MLSEKSSRGTKKVIELLKNDAMRRWRKERSTLFCSKSKPDWLDHIIWTVIRYCPHVYSSSVMTEIDDLTQFWGDSQLTLILLQAASQRVVIMLSSVEAVPNWPAKHVLVTNVRKILKDLRPGAWILPGPSLYLSKVPTADFAKHKILAPQRSQGTAVSSDAPIAWATLISISSWKLWSNALTLSIQRAPIIFSSTHPNRYQISLLLSFSEYGCWWIEPEWKQAYLSVCGKCITVVSYLSLKNGHLTDTDDTVFTRDTFFHIILISDNLTFLSNPYISLKITSDPLKKSKSLGSADDDQFHWFFHRQVYTNFTE